MNHEFDALILAAMPEEVTFLCRNLEAPKRRLLGARRERFNTRGRRIEMRTGILARKHVGIIVTGVGMGSVRALVSCLDDLQVDHQAIARRCIVTGFSGALTPDLALGTPIVASVVVDASDGAVIALPREQVSDSPDARPLVPATVFTAREMLLHEHEKRHLLARYPRPGPAVVDLESFPLVHMGSTKGMDCSVVRVVSDALDESLPEFIRSTVTEDGSIDRVRLVATSLAAPRRWAALLRLRARAMLCARVLAESIEGVLNP